MKDSQASKQHITKIIIRIATLFFLDWLIATLFCLEKNPKMLMSRIVYVFMIFEMGVKIQL